MNNQREQITKDQILHYAKRRWYVQEFNCTPLLIGPCALSGFDLEPSLSDTFKIFLFDYNGGYGKMYYPLDDIERLSKIVQERLKDDGWIESVRKEYDERCAKNEAKLLQILENLEGLKEEELIDAIRFAIKALRESVGQAHIIEPFSLTADAIIMERLSKYVQGTKLNTTLSLLSTPTEKSFINEREEDLHSIATAPLEEQEQLIEEHLTIHYWEQNTYAGKCTITPAEIKEELQTMQKYRASDFDVIKEQKAATITGLGLDQETINLLETAEYITNWQDDRKKNILKAIDHTETLIGELSRRLGIKHKLLRYSSPYELEKGLPDAKELLPILEERHRGVIHVIIAEGEGFLTGKECDEFRIITEKISGMEEHLKEFNGLSASPGTAVRYVKICRSLADIKSVQEGDILVAPMTRPEFLPAMKKATAIITDEGGITSHAAIISREMGIPCVIGTKEATKLLKDGDLVEVKANHGLISILKPEVEESNS